MVDSESQAIAENGAGELRLSVDCSVENIRHLAGIVRCYLTDRGVDDSSVNACESAFVEGCNNAVLHASWFGKRKDIGARVLCDEQQIRIVVEDHTRGFNLPEDVGLPAIESENGRGLFIITALMDSVTYERGKDGNKLLLTKWRPGFGACSSRNENQNLTA